MIQAAAASYTVDHQLLASRVSHQTPVEGNVTLNHEFNCENVLAKN